MISVFKNKIYNSVLILFTFYILFAPVIDNVAPIKILGFSFFITFLPTIILYTLFIVLMPNLSKKDLRLFFFLLGLVLILYLIHSIVGINEKSFLDYMVYHRYVLYLFLVITIFKYINLSKYYIYYIYALLFSLLFGSLTGLFYLFGLPTFRILKEDVSIYEMDRFGGIWGAPNGFSNLMVLLLMGFLFCKDNSFIIKISICIIVFLGCISAGSRSPIIYMFFLLPFIFFDFKNRSKSILKYTYFMILAVLFVFFVLYTTGLFEKLLNLEGALTRLLEQNATEDLRKDKGTFFLNYLFSNMQNIFLGINPKEQLLDVQFSDNGILLFMLDNGVPFFLIYILLIFLLLKDNVKYFNISITIMVFSIILLLTSAMNNVVLWDNYMYISVLVFFLIKNKQKIEYFRSTF